MKSIRLLTTAALILSVFAISAKVQASTDKLTRDIKTAVKIEISKPLMEQISITFNLNREEILNILDLLFVDNSNRIEDWMVNPEYLDQAAPGHNLECWMLDEDYLEAETSQVECWMMNPEYLSDPDSSTGIESWMMNPGYLDQK